MKKEIALYLGSGGARGYTHIGIIRELERSGYIIKHISGSSMGALIGGLYAAGKLDEYEKWVLNLNPVDVLKLLDFSFKKSGFIEGEKVFNIIADMIGSVNIEDMAISYVAVATDIKSKHSYHFTHGSLSQAIRASIAIPTLFTPVIYDDMVLVDGGLSNPLGIVKANEDSLYSIVVDLSGEDEIKQEIESFESSNVSIMNKINQFFSSKKITTKNLSSIQIVQDSIDTMQKIITDIQIEQAKPDLKISIPANICEFYEFHKAKEMIAYGEKRAKSALL